MQLKQLEYFITTAECLNISRAAQQLYITQQALSEQINKLEKEYGVRFFIRGKKISLTHEGEYMLKTAKQILAQERNLRNELNSLNEKVHGTINLGGSYVRARLFFPYLLSAFNQKFPLVKVNIYSGNSEKIKADIQSGVTDIVIGFDQFYSHDISTLPLGNERLFIAIPGKILNKIYGDSWQNHIEELKKGADLSDFIASPFVMINHSNYIWSAARQLFNSKRISPNIIFEGNDIELVCRLSKQGMGISFVPELMVSTLGELFRADGEQTLYAFPLSGPIYLPLVIAYNNKQYYSQLTNAFIDIIKHEYKNHILQ